MIEEILQVARSQELTGREAFRKQPIHWLIDLNAEGEVVGLSPTAAESTDSDTKAKKPPKSVRGKLFNVPITYHQQVINGRVTSVKTNQSSWVADFLTAPAWELFPELVSAIRKADVRKLKKIETPRNRTKREEFLELIEEARRDDDLKDHEGLAAVVTFLQSPEAYARLSEFLNSEERKASDEGKDKTDDKGLAETIAEKNERVSFRINGKLIFEDGRLKRWWEDRTRKLCDAVAALSPVGSDFYIEGEGRLTQYFPKVFSTIQFASFDKAPYKSFGLENQTTALRIETAEQVAAGLNWLLNKRNKCALSLGKMVAVYWIRVGDETKSADFVSLMQTPDTLQVTAFFKAVHAGQYKRFETADFYAALFMKGKGRFALRSWHTDTLDNVVRQFEKFYQVLEAVKPKKESNFLTLPQLATATVIKSKNSKPAPDTYKIIFETALLGRRMPEKILSAAIARQRVEVTMGDAKDKGFLSRLVARAALIALYFRFTKNYAINHEKGEFMSPNGKSLNADAAYLCGRLLAVLDEIHRVAHQSTGGTRSSPANRLYSSASSTPALVFPQLCKMARVHLDKISSKEGGGLAIYFERGSKESEDGKKAREGLAGIVARLQDVSPIGFPVVLNLEEQGRFALGFYYERNLSFASGKTGAAGVEDAAGEETTEDVDAEDGEEEDEE